MGAAGLAEKLADLVALVAEVKGWSPDRAARVTHANGERFLRWSRWPTGAGGWGAAAGTTAANNHNGHDVGGGDAGDGGTTDDARENRRREVELAVAKALAQRVAP